jgi:hypothetical protein
MLKISRSTDQKAIADMRVHVRVKLLSRSMENVFVVKSFCLIPYYVQLDGPDVGLSGTCEATAVSL